VFWGFGSFSPLLAQAKEQSADVQSITPYLKQFQQKTSLIYLKENGPLYTKYQIIDKIRKINSRNIMLLLQEIFQIDKALCVYQCKKNLHLTWEKLI
jgi:hypothetical protein